MRDEEFDKLLKKQIQEDEHIPQKINQLFSDFESEVNMKENEKRNKLLNFNYYLKTVSIAASTALVMFVGGCTYAHVNGRETIISPLLKNIGISSKYEENATQFNKEVTKKDVTVRMLDGAIDDTSLIVGYEIQISNINPNAWIEVNGEYKINGINIMPVNTNIDKLTDTSFVYYQVFDVNEINLTDTKNVKINANIQEIKEYTEAEDIDSAYAVYGRTYANKWNLEETINIKNLKEAKVYEFNNSKKYEIAENVNVSATEFITGSYTNILKIKTDKTNYTDNSFEKYYKVLDNNNKEIARFFEEDRQYDHRAYTDRLISDKLHKNSKINIEVYMKKIEENKFRKVVTMPIDLSQATEKVELKSSLKQYKNNDYSFKYKEDWNLTPKLDTTRVGPKSIYLGALELEIPSTTNSEYTSSIYVKTENANTTLEEYAKHIRIANTSSPSEYYKEIGSSEVNLKNQKAYQITAQTTDGEETYIKQDTFATVNGKIYRITFAGSEKEYNNWKNDVNEFISNFEV